MKKLGAILAVGGFAAFAALGLASCGSSSGKEGGTLQGHLLRRSRTTSTPQLSYTVEGWTAMYDTYIPLLTYAHAERRGGQQGGSRASPRALPKITDGGKTYTLFLRPGLKYSDGTPVKASDFTFAVERMFKLNSGGSPFYTDIVGAEKFQKTKQRRNLRDRDQRQDRRNRHPPGQAPGHLHQRAGADVRRAGAARTRPTKTSRPTPPPATGPYVITSSEPGRGWDYERNPQWAKNNAKLMPELPSGHVDKIDITVIRNRSTQVNDVEQGKLDWMQNPPPPDRYAEVKSKYEGTQFRIEPTISTYYFWMNTTKPPFNDLKVRQAVNYAVDTEALERIYAGQLVATSADPAAGDAGLQEVRTLPAQHGQGEGADQGSRPLRSQHHGLDRQRNRKQRSRRILPGRAEETRLQHEAESRQRRQLLHGDRQPDRRRNWTPAGPTGSRTTRTRTTSSSRCSPAKASCRPTTGTSPQIDIPTLNKEIKQARRRTARAQAGKAEYAELDKAYMEQAPWAPYGNRDALDLRLQRDQPRKGDLEPDLRRRPDQLPVQVVAARSPWYVAYRRLRRNRAALGLPRRSSS